MSGEPVKIPKNVMFHMSQNEEVLRAWFNGELPHEGAIYALRCDKFATSPSTGVAAAEFSLVRIAESVKAP